MRRRRTIIVSFPEVVSIPTRKLPQSVPASGDSRSRLGERVAARLLGHRSGEASPLGSAPGTKTYAVPPGRNGNWPCHRYPNVPRACPEETIERRKAVQCGNGSCARRRRVCCGSEDRSYLIHVIYTRFKEKSRAKTQCESAL